MNRKDLIATIRAKASMLCVGLDPDLQKLPEGISRDAAGILEFNKAIIDATREYAVAYKPNLAFYEALGPKGWDVLARSLEYIGPNHFTIADAKRGDIGNTSRMYASAFFEQLDFDSLTVAPYMGADSVQPFLSFREKWVVLLALTSNPGAGDFQLLEMADEGEGQFLYEKVLLRACEWGSPENTMFVVGATRPELLSRIRRLVPDHFLLVPGVGAQGGSLSEVCEYGLNRDVGLLVNASRSICYASAKGDFAEAARKSARHMAFEMKEILQKKSLL